MQIGEVKNNYHVIWNGDLLSVIITFVDVKWRIGSANAYGARGPGFDPTPEHRMAFIGSFHPPSFRQRTEKPLIYVMSCWNQPKNSFKKWYKFLSQNNNI